jgi:putative ABC transport system substrate-binding protein
MRRRGFLQVAVLSTALSRVARAQQRAPSSRIVKIAVLWQVDSADELLKIYSDALTGRFSDLGYVDGKTAQFIHRSTNEPPRLHELAKDLVDQAPDVIIASSPLVAIQLKKATTTIPIVFAIAPNPVGSGIVDSLARPGGNITGLSIMADDTAGKRLGYFKEAVSTLRRTALLADPKDPSFAAYLSMYSDAAKSLGFELRAVEVPSPDEIGPIFSAIAKDGYDGAVAIGIMSLLERKRIGAAALSQKIPTIGFSAEAVPYGLLFSYGLDFTEFFRRAAGYADKILKGAKPADLPVEQPAGFKLVVNLKAARALGLHLSSLFIATADEVIE